MVRPEIQPHLPSDEPNSLGVIQLIPGYPPGSPKGMAMLDAFMIKNEPFGTGHLDAPNDQPIQPARCHHPRHTQGQRGRDSRFNALVQNEQGAESEKEDYERRANRRA